MAAVSLDPSTRRCGVCDMSQAEDRTLLRCARCRTSLYCGKTCQRAHWPVHKKVCKMFCEMNGYLKKGMYPDIIEHMASGKINIDNSINWLEKNKEGHAILMLQYPVLQYGKALVAHPDGNFPEEAYVKLFSDYVIALCQMRIDANCFQNEFKNCCILNCKHKAKETPLINLLLEKPEYHERVQEKVIAYFGSLDFSKLSSPEYFLYGKEFNVFTRIMFSYPKEKYESQRMKMMELLQKDFQKLGLAKTIKKYFIPTTNETSAFDTIQKLKQTT